MKKLIAAVTALTIVSGAAGAFPARLDLSPACATANAADEVKSGKCGENATYEIKDGVLTISGTGETENWVYGGMPPWFGNKTIKKVVIENGITNIADFSFQSIGVTEIEIPETVEYIGQKAFEKCGNLKEIKIPAAVKKIGKCAFNDCKALESVNIPEGVEEIPGNAFSNCWRLKSIELPESVTAIGDCAFYGCKDLKEITIPKNVKTMGFQALCNCESLSSVVFEGPIEKMDYRALYDSTKLEKIVLPDSLTELGENALGNCIQGERFRVTHDLTVCCHKNTVGEKYLKDNGFTYYGTDANGYEEYLSDIAVTLRNSLTGDVNGDGSVDGSDATMVLKEYGRRTFKGTFTYVQQKLGDVDGNGAIDGSDATLILKYFGERDSIAPGTTLDKCAAKWLAE